MTITSHTSNHDINTYHIHSNRHACPNSCATRILCHCDVSRHCSGMLKPWMSNNQWIRVFVAKAQVPQTKLTISINQIPCIQLFFAFSVVTQVISEKLAEIMFWSASSVLSIFWFARRCQSLPFWLRVNRWRFPQFYQGLLTRSARLN